MKVGNNTIIGFPLLSHVQQRGFGNTFRRSLSHQDKLRVYLCFCKENTPLSDLVHVACTRWIVEMCFAETKRRRWLRQLRGPLLAGLVSSYHSGNVRPCTFICPESGITGYGSRVFFSTNESGDNLDAFKKWRNLSSASAKQN